MLLETGTVVSKTTHALMVETIKKSTCAHCSAASGCGHAVLSKFSTNTNQVRVLLGKFSTEDVGLGDDVTIGVPEYVVVKGALLIYMLPLILSISSTLNLRVQPQVGHLFSIFFVRGLQNTQNCTFKCLANWLKLLCTNIKRGINLRRLYFTAFGSFINIC